MNVLNSYEILPVALKTMAASGAEIRAAKDLGYLALYWKEFGPYSPYQLFMEGTVSEQLLRTKDGNRLVGASLRNGSGVILLLPPIDLDRAGCTKENKAGEFVWTTKAAAFGKRLISTLVNTADTLRAEVSATPAPDWTKAEQYRIREESSLEEAIVAATRELETIQQKRAALESRLRAAGGPRRLLFEGGKQLEAAILEALRTLGFKAGPFADGESEFDAVFESDEGRFLGEAEGKDNRPISIDKISQLERNLHEDFTKDGIDEFAKGVLFGNAFRIHDPEKRGEYFTEKCLKAAARLGVALVRTPDLFPVIQYLLDEQDEPYARLCRQALLSTRGAIVAFPSPPRAASIVPDAVVLDANTEATGAAQPIVAADGRSHHH